MGTPIQKMDVDRLPKLVLAITFGKPENKASAAYTLQQLSGNRENRSKMALHPGFLQAVCSLLEPNETKYDEKLQEHGASILVNLLLEDPLCDYLSISAPHQIILGQEPELLSLLHDTLFSGDISIKKHSVKAFEYLTEQVELAHHFVLSESGFCSGILDAAKSAGKEAIEMSALRTLGNLAAHVDLQVELAHTKGLIDHLVAMLDSESDDARSIAKEILTHLSENEELQNIIE